MSIDENTRLDLRQAFEELIGPDLAHAAMEAMPPLDYDQFATKTDVDNLGTSLRVEIAAVRTELKSDIAEVRADMTDLRGELKSDIAEVRADMTGLRGDMAELRGELKANIAALDLRMASNLRITVFTQFATMATFAGFVVGLG